MVYTAITGPDNYSAVYEKQFIGTRADIKFRTAQFILNRLRLAILNENLNVVAVVWGLWQVIKKTPYIDSKKALYCNYSCRQILGLQLFESIKDLARPGSGNKADFTECIHLTLKFLGRTDLLMLREIMAAIKDTVEAFESFSFTLGTIIGAFPKIHSAQILFAPVEDTSGQIADIFKALEDNLAKIKIKGRKKIHSSYYYCKNKGELKYLLIFKKNNF